MSAVSRDASLLAFAMLPMEALMRCYARHLHGEPSRAATLIFAIYLMAERLHSLRNAAAGYR